LPYPLIGFNVDPVSPISEKTETPIKILVGNSAAISNEHEYAFEPLSHLANEKVEIIVPLNYAGTPDYIFEVIKKGLAIFGDKFKA